MGRQIHYTEGHANGCPSELSLPNDDVFRCVCTYDMLLLLLACVRANALQTLAPVLNIPIIESSILPMLDKLLSDDIPNIRFNVAKSYSVLIDVLRRIPENGSVADLEKQQKAKGLSGSSTITPRARSMIQDHILPNLEKLQDDDDVDVRYFAVTAAQTWNDEMQMSP